MTIFIFAGPLQIYVIQSLNMHTYLMVFIASLIISSRFLLMSALLTPQLIKFTNKTKLIFAFLMLSASSFTVTYTKITTMNNSSKINLFHYYLGVAIPSYLVAVIGTAIGYKFIFMYDNKLIPIILSMVLPIHFVSLTAIRSSNKLTLIVTTLGFIFCPVILMLPNQFIQILVPILFGMAIYFIKRNSEAK